MACLKSHLVAVPAVTVLKNFIKLRNSKDEITRLLVIFLMFMSCLFSAFRLDKAGEASETVERRTLR